VFLIKKKLLKMHPTDCPFWYPSCEILLKTKKKSILAISPHFKRKVEPLAWSVRNTRPNIGWGLTAGVQKTSPYNFYGSYKKYKYRFSSFRPPVIKKRLEA